MFDLDVEGMLQHLSKIKDATLLLSNPCIEYWFLLHFNDVNRELSSAQCLALLKNKDPEYTKGAFSTTMRKMLIDNIKEASQRANNKEAYVNPSTTINLLTDMLMADSY